ncbi:MAG: hypothetical protein LBQ50_10070 [Planctomycetaceae bacterium]|jgi:hypothetical protein|nr:hypothetical protein [Planctomycetaceae bacterium]
MKILHRLTFGLSLTSQTILWLAGILALIGFLWREPLNRTDNVTATLVLTVWVGFLIFLSFVSCKPNEADKRYFFWIPVLLIGFLLPFPWTIFYIFLLGTAEVIRRFPIKKTYKKTENPLTPSILESPDEEDDFDEFVTQKIVRRDTETGKNRLEGSFLVEFCDNQSTATIHLPFYPAFESDPKVEVFLLDDVDVKWNIFNPRNFGVRIDLKRNSCETNRIRILVVAE